MTVHEPVEYNVAMNRRKICCISTITLLYASEKGQAKKVFMAGLPQALMDISYP